MSKLRLCEYRNVWKLIEGDHIYRGAIRNARGRETRGIFLPGRKREAVHIRLAAILRGNVFFPFARLLGNRVFISNIMHSGGDI